MIDEYHFGSITVDGKTYDRDVEVRSVSRKGNKIEVVGWWRRDCHIIDVGDLKDAIEKKPEVIIIGTGSSGMAKVTPETRDFVVEKGIELIIDRTKEAVKTFNMICEDSVIEEGKHKKVIGLFHLTC